jgi:predicted SAM-dependent methyltransferase
MVKKVLAPIYVQYGCGWSCPDGWMNFDVSPSLRIERLPIVGPFIKVNARRFPENVLLGDIVSGLPVADGTVQGAYASHVLEHLSYEEFWIALRNTYKMLAPGGIFRLVVPDLESRARLYCDELSRGRADSNSMFLRLTYLGVSQRPRNIFSRLRASLGNSAHLWMWDYCAIEEALQKSGFVKVRRAAFNDCDDSMFLLVEDKKRFYWSLGDQQSSVWPECAVEARKPNIVERDLQKTA